MNILDFQKWVRHRQARPTKHLPECDRLLHVIAAAGPQGISRGDLGGQIQLSRQTLDQLLEALLQIGRITKTIQHDEVIFRATTSNTLNSNTLVSNVMIPTPTFQQR